MKIKLNNDDNKYKLFTCNECEIDYPCLFIMHDNSIVSIEELDIKFCPLHGKGKWRKHYDDISITK